MLVCVLLHKATPLALFRSYRPGTAIQGRAGTRQRAQCRRGQRPVRHAVCTVAARLMACGGPPRLGGGSSTLFGHRCEVEKSSSQLPAKAPLWPPRKSPCLGVGQKVFSEGHMGRKYPSADSAKRDTGPDPFPLLM
jgi:hypothetical protein